MAFAPKQTAILVGTEVTWTNSTIGIHTVTFNQALALLPGSAQVPAGVEPFDSGAVRAGLTFVKTFTVPGEYKYFCRPHERMGHLGELTVIAENPTATIPPAPELPGTEQKIERMNSFVGQDVRWDNASAVNATIAITSASRLDADGSALVLVPATEITAGDQFQFSFDSADNVTVLITMADGRTFQHSVLVWNR